MRAFRDLTRQQFAAELKRHGFQQVLIWIEDTSGEQIGTSWGTILYGQGPKKGRINRRATLAYVIREREKLARRKFEEAA